MIINSVADPQITGSAENNERINSVADPQVMDSAENNVRIKMINIRIEN